MLIDCETCAVRDVHCGECVVTALLGLPEQAPGSMSQVDESVPAGHYRVPGYSHRLDDTERRALEVLADHGLVAALRLVPGSAPGARPA
jgi:hypothetical protein